MAAQNATERLGRFVARCADLALAPDVTTKAAICLVDALGLTVAAREEATARAARAVVTPVAQGRGTARIWADGSWAALSDAVVTNGIAVHAHFQDDTDHESWSHPGSLIVPVAASLGEARDAPLRAVLAAIAAGYATMKWLGAGETVSRGMIARGLRTSPTFGTLGAAAAAAVCLGLDAPQATSAIGIAASTTGGTLEPVRCGSDEWRVQNGRAAQGGLLAAQLAQNGVVGAPDALEGPRGLLRALAGLETTPEQWQSDPDPAALLGVMAKPFATLGDNMPAAMAAQLLHRDALDLTRVRRITVTTWRPYSEYPGTSFKGPFLRTVQTQASTAFAVAAMLVHGELGYDIGLRHRDDPRILALVEKTSVLPHDGAALDATVEVAMEDGRRRRSAGEASRTLIFQDEPRAAEVLDERFARAGFAAGAGKRLAEQVFASAARDGKLPIRTLIDHLTPDQSRKAP